MNRKFDLVTVIVMLAIAFGLGYGWATLYSVRRSSATNSAISEVFFVDQQGSWIHDGIQYQNYHGRMYVLSYGEWEEVSKGDGFYFETIGGSRVKVVVLKMATIQPTIVPTLLPSPTPIVH